MSEGSEEQQKQEPKRHLLVAEKLQAFAGEKQILHDVSLVARSGNLMAIMGPSGGGKTTLLNTISGRMQIRSGSVKLNGKTVSARMRKNFGYVTQMDVFFSMLTLRQVVEFAARVKLPDTMTKQERDDRMMEVVRSLELEKCLDTMIGSPFWPGLSGGEKKRANIACELLRNPDVLLLDEPTSGLDASLALTLMELLGKWAKDQNKVVIMSIHQPSSQIFLSFEDLMLLCEGHIAFFGKQSEMVNHFKSIGVLFPKDWSAGDYMLEVVSRDSEHKDLVIKQGEKFSSVGYIRKTTTVSDLAAIKLREAEEGEGEGSEGAASSTAEPLDVGHVNPAFADEAKNCEVEVDADDEGEEEASRRVSWFRQLIALSIRGFYLSRMRFLSIFPIIQIGFVGFLSSVLWFQLPRNEDRFNDLIGCVFFLTINLSFFPLFEAITSFQEDIMIVRHERRAGMYQIGAYYASKMITEMPLVIVIPFLSLTLVFWVANLGLPQFYVPFVFGILTNALACQGVGLFLGLVTDQPKINMTVAYIFMMFSLLFGGFFSTAIPSWLVWAKWFSFIRYCYHFCLLLSLEGSQDFACSITSSSQYASCQLPPGSNATGSIPVADIINQFPDEFLPIWANYLVIVAFLIIFRLAGYLWLRYMKKV